MAGDWMKMELDTPHKEEVIGIGAFLRIHPDEAFGKCFRLWAWADRNSMNGKGMKITEKFIDHFVQKKNFAAAMRSVGWLTGTDGKLNFPGFLRHNGKTAKKRALTNRRVAAKRERDKNVTLPALPKALPEKRREEIKNTPLTPSGGASEGGDGEIISKIKSFRRRWGKGPALDAKEARIFRKNRAGWAAYGADDWAVVGEFMRAVLAPGSALFQPELLTKALEAPVGLLADATSWKGNQRPANVLTMPERTEEDAAALAEFLKKGQG